MGEETSTPMLSKEKAKLTLNFSRRKDMSFLESEGDESHRQELDRQLEWRQGITYLNANDETTGFLFLNLYPVLPEAEFQ